MLASEHLCRMPGKEEGGYAFAVRLTPMSISADGDLRTGLAVTAPAPGLLDKAVAVVMPMLRTEQ